jgi:hypothetical protein
MLVAAFSARRPAFGRSPQNIQIGGQVLCDAKGTLTASEFGAMVEAARKSALTSSQLLYQAIHHRES